MQDWFCSYHADSHHLLSPGRPFCSKGQHFHLEGFDQQILFVA